MQSNIHPKYNQSTKVTCSCGNSFVTGSTLDQITVEICSQCHPFFTGEMKFVDTQGRVEKFKLKRQASQAMAGKSKSKKKANQHADSDDDQPKTLKEMMQVVKTQTKPADSKQNPEK